MADRLADLPGGDLISAGLADLPAGRESIGAYLVAIGATRLRRLGLPVPPGDALPTEAEIGLYRLLCRSEGSGAYSQYNSLIRQLVSFERALEQRTQPRGERPG